MPGRRKLENLTGREGESLPDGSADRQDPLVVSTEQLAQAVEIWAKRFEQDHPPESAAWTGQRTARMPSPMGPIVVLCRKARVSEEVVRRLLRRQSKVTTLGVADRLLVAMGMMDMLHTTIEVVPNPSWSTVRWERWRELATEGCGDLTDDDASAS